ncbi:MAG: hypothetical protein IPL54_04940 [Chitinophagaceae bacterium]|nr:hypothetical protein [Chitinophagaceae bacterium]
MQNSKLLFCCVIFFATAASLKVKAQTIENSINLYGNNFPREKIHIHFDKESYMPGETIWFKAYLLEENFPSERSTNFYAALYDEQGKLVQQKISPVFKGSSDGFFVIPDSLRSSQLICRAYTGWMLNFDTTMLFSRAIKIRSNINQAQGVTPKKTVNLRFFPEGGNIIEGTVNTIAFKANYNNGLPYLVDGVIKKQETGEVMIPLSQLHEGMGKFDLDFPAGDKYYAEWLDNDGIKQQTMLPDAKPRGVSLKLTVQKDKLYFNLVNKTGADSLHVLMYMYQKVFYKTNIAVPATEPFTGMVPITTLPSGTMQLTVFDANWQPVAERVAFINNNNFTINAAIQSKEISTQKRGKNVLEISVADTIPANMSLSISDADMNNEMASNTIVSDLLLKGDLKGYIHNPAFYFTNNTDAVLKGKLDLVMLTHGWRRYNWADMMVQKMPAIRTAADDYLSVYGQVAKEALDKLEKDEPVNLIVKNIDSVNSFYSVIPERSGALKLGGLIFYDSARIYFTFNKSKLLNKQMAFSTSNFTLNQPLFINNFDSYLLADTAGTNLSQNSSLFNYYKKNNGISSFNDEKTIEGVVVRTNNRRNWQNDPLLKMDEKYASGMFSGGANSFSIDVLHDETAWTKLDVLSYINGKIPGVSLGNFDPRNGRKLLYQGSQVVVFIDGQELTTLEIESLNLDDIAYIKLVPKYFGGRSGDGAGYVPAISIYRKKGDDLIDRRPKETDLNMVKVAGYSPFKEFYSPDYSQSNTSGGTDARTTLLWMPYILTDKANRKVPVSFYNNDFTKKMRIVLEGINDDGKMIRIEKIVE